MSKNIIKDKSYEFALRILKLSRSLKKDKEYEIASQVLRAGTSIGANVEEAIGGQSKKNSIAKMFIALRGERNKLLVKVA